MKKLLIVALILCAVSAFAGPLDSICYVDQPCDVCGTDVVSYKVVCAMSCVQDANGNIVCSDQCHTYGYNACGDLVYYQ